MVKIPKLAEDRQNWKIYHAKFLKVAATFDCLEVLAGRPYAGDDWDGCNALLCCTFMEPVPPPIYFNIRCRTAYKNFKYLTKHFHDNNPIPCANELQCTGTAAAVEMPENYPMSTNAATEQHVNAKPEKEDLSTTQDLTQGTEDIDDGNVGCTQDPCTNFKALVKGISAKHTETTPVILKSALLHKMQIRLQSSLPLTLRPPIDGKPCECKQEVVDSDMMAGCTNGTVKLAKPTKITDIDRTALLGGEPAERACGVDEGDGTEHKGRLWLQETNLLCKETCQCNGNTENNLPIAYGLPLEGEWSVYPSSESDMLIIMLIESEDLGSGDTPHMYLEGMCWRVDNADHPGNRSDGSRYQVDRSSSQTDALRGLTDAPSMSNNAETEL